MFPQNYSHTSSPDVRLKKSKPETIPGDDENFALLGRNRICKSAKYIFHNKIM